MIDQFTDLYISASARPGSFGATVFNQLFIDKKINALYLPRKFENSYNLIQTIKTMSIKGCGVSSPLKNSVIKHLDSVDAKALQLNSVNTIINYENKLIGYNTDFSGAKSVVEFKFKELGLAPASARILGSGGVVSSLILALQELGVMNIEVVCRNSIPGEDLREQFKVKKKLLNSDEVFMETDILINTIPTRTDENNYLYHRFIPLSSLIFDLGVCPADNEIITIALKNKKQIIRGYEMALFQLIEQFNLYFNFRPTSEEVLNIINSKYLKAK